VITILEIVGNVMGALCLAGAVALYVKRKQLNALVDKFTGMLDQAGDDAQFRAWAEVTSLIVTTGDGYMFMSSIRELERARLEDHSWTDPICVSLLRDQPHPLHPHKHIAKMGPPFIPGIRDALGEHRD
jgi:hypothetical protein